MLGPLRTLISVAFVVMFLWAAFTVKLGPMTFADHVDRIGQTPEAQDLLDGARGRVRPTLEEVKQRVLGEYVEAPTHLAQPAPAAAPRTQRSPFGPSEDDPPAAALATRSPKAADRKQASAPREPATRKQASTPRAPSEPAARKQPPASVRPATASRASTADGAKLPGRRTRP